MTAYTTYFQNPIQVGSTIDNLTGDNGNVILSTAASVSNLSWTATGLTPAKVTVNLPGTARLLRITAEISGTITNLTNVTVTYFGQTQVIASTAFNANVPLAIAGGYTIVNPVGNNVGLTYGAFDISLTGTATGAGSGAVFTVLLEYAYPG